MSTTRTTRTNPNNSSPNSDDRRRNNGYSETGVPPGIDLKVHSTVILVGLESERGQRMNGSIGNIVDEMKQDRYPIELVADDDYDNDEAANNNANTNTATASRRPPSRAGRRPTTNTNDNNNTTNDAKKKNNKNWIYIKPTNLRLVCSNPNCYCSHISNLKQCKNCGISVYCHETCQLQHWKSKPPREKGHKHQCQEWIVERIEKRKKKRIIAESGATAGTATASATSGAATRRAAPKPVASRS